ncbi:ESCRT-III subunit protein snf7 [Dimargaris xerosporica]|nr:ESCRT-III subunit protein snf7 [Dimargaris xerosporica]
MKLFFGSKAKATPKEAIVKLRETLLMLEKREKHLEARIDSELKTAKLNASKNKRVALAALKRKKRLEGQIEKVAGARMTLEEQMSAIESANINLETMNAMRTGSEAMKSIHKDLNIDKVDATMDDIRDQMDIANEVSEAISQPNLFGTEVDEDELNAELEQLEQEELDSQLLNAENPPIHAPRVPQTELAVPKNLAITQDEEDELEELRASMAI